MRLLLATLLVLLMGGTARYCSHQPPAFAPQPGEARAIRLSRGNDTLTLTSLRRGGGAFRLEKGEEADSVKIAALLDLLYSLRTQNPTPEAVCAALQQHSYGNPLVIEYATWDKKGGKPDFSTRYELSLRPADSLLCLYQPESNTAYEVESLGYHTDFVSTLSLDPRLWGAPLRFFERPSQLISLSVQYPAARNDSFILRFDDNHRATLLTNPTLRFGKMVDTTRVAVFLSALTDLPVAKVDAHKGDSIYASLAPVAPHVIFSIDLRNGIKREFRLYPTSPNEGFIVDANRAVYSIARTDWDVAQPLRNDLLEKKH